MYVQKQLFLFLATCVHPLAYTYPLLTRTDIIRLLSDDAARWRWRPSQYPSPSIDCLST